MIRRFIPLLPAAVLLGCSAAPPSVSPPPPPVEAPTPTMAVPTMPTSSLPSADPAPHPSAEPLANQPERDDKGKPPARIGRAAVTSTDAPLASAITQDEVMREVNKSADFNRCYSVGAGASKSWRAKVTVKATVGPGGNVNAVEVVTSTAKNPKVDACVLESFKKIVFPRPAGAGATTFTFPLSFDGMEEVR